MKLFERHGGYWLFWCSAVYLTVGLMCAVYYRGVPTALIQVVWLLAIAMPFYFPPLGRWLNMSVEWDRNMLKWFKKKEQLQELSVPEIPKTEVEAPAPKEPEKKTTGQTMYSIGLTDENRVSLKMGYSEITMNAQGVQNIIDQLELFKLQILDEAQPKKTGSKKNA